MADQKRYTLRLPFRLPQGQQISNLDQPYMHDCGELILKLGKSLDKYFISVGNFSDEATAWAFLPKLWAGLLWTMLNHGLSPEARLSPQEVVHADSPAGAIKRLFNKREEVAQGPYSLIDDSFPAVYCTDSPVCVIGMGQVTVSIGHSAANTLAMVTNAFLLPFPENIMEDGKLRVALDLYNAHFRETGSSTRFLTLTMSLEALTPSEPKHKCAAALIGRWVAEATQLRDSFGQDSDEWEAYDSLIREIGFRKERSIRSSIRKLVYSSLQQAEDPEAEQLSRQAVRFYDMRSRLVHDGYLPEHDLGQAVTSMRDIVARVLKNRFLHAAQISLASGSERPITTTESEGVP